MQILQIHGCISIVLLAFLHASRAEAEPSSAELQKKAIKSLMLNTFMTFYTAQQYPPTSPEFNDGLAVYNKIKEPGSSGYAISSLVPEVRHSALTKLLGIWRDTGLISLTEEGRLKALLESKLLLKTIRETVNLRSNGEELVFGRIAIISLTKGKGDNGIRSTVLYSFYRIKLAKKRDEGASSCTLWGIYCQSKLEFKQCESDEGVNRVSDSEVKSLGNYLRGYATKKFIDDNKASITSISESLAQFESHLPDELQEVKRKFHENPDKKPEELFESDPIDGNKYEL